MRRMKKDAIVREAQRRVGVATSDLIARFGEWNKKKIIREMERTLRNDRLGKPEKDLPGS